jgi:hypothetical protein
MHYHLTSSIKAEAARLMVIASDTNHADWQKAVHGICDIEKVLPHEGRQQLYRFLSDYTGDDIDDAREVYFDNAEFC